MSLATSLASVVYAEHLSKFPDAINGTRSNPETGVPHHVVSKAFIDALCAAVAATLTELPIRDTGSGTDDTPGQASVVDVSFPGAKAAEAYFLTTMGWTGRDAQKVASVFITKVLQTAGDLVRLQMNDNERLGTGIAKVNAESNPGLEAMAKKILLRELPIAFQATGKFCEGDIPGQPVNRYLMEQMTTYAEALAMGIASIQARVEYVGTALSAGIVTGAINTGFLK